MSTAATESSPTTALAALAARTASEPEEPWLFYRRDWNWHWRSWDQVADQVARGAAALADAEPAVGLRPDLEPDTVAASLAVQAAGRVLNLGLSLEAESLPGTPALPACRSRFERWQPQALDLDAAEAGRLRFAADAAPVSQRQLFEDAERFDGKLPPFPKRPILCATPALAARDFQVVLAWTLLSGAAWVLEPETEAFHETVLWSRPSVVVATAAELERLTAAMARRRRRRHSRLVAVVNVDQTPLSPVHPLTPFPARPGRGGSGGG